MSVDNRIPSEPYIELNGVTVYTEGVYHHGKSPEIGKCTIGEKMMNREYNGLGTHDIVGIKRVNELIDELITYMDEGDIITITGGDDREFTVVIDSTRIQKPKVDNVTIVRSNNETVVVQLSDGRIVNIDKEQIDGKEC